MLCGIGVADAMEVNGLERPCGDIRAPRKSVRLTGDLDREEQTREAPVSLALSSSPW